MYRKLIIVFVIVFFRFSPLIQITVVMYMQLLILIYINNVRPMETWYYNALVYINEYMMLMSAVCSYLFTGFVYSPLAMSALGNLWLFLIMFPVAINGAFLWILSLAKIKWTADAWVLRKERMRVRNQLIKEGKIVIKKQITENEKKILHFKNQQAKKRAKVKRELRRALREQRRQEVILE